ncbi:hypothetical protein Y023_2460 [Burkholderia pseudomallei A79D]|nr:hypothetical protein Y023_2460 [Burkholderia pseudomallei A79D]
MQPASAASAAHAATARDARRRVVCSDRIAIECLRVPLVFRRQ